MTLYGYLQVPERCLGVDIVGFGTNFLEEGTVRNIFFQYGEINQVKIKKTKVQFFIWSPLFSIANYLAGGWLLCHRKF